MSQLPTMPPSAGLLSSITSCPFPLVNIWGCPAGGAAGDRSQWTSVLEGQGPPRMGALQGQVLPSSSGRENVGTTLGTPHLRKHSLAEKGSHNGPTQASGHLRVSEREMYADYTWGQSAGVRWASPRPKCPCCRSGNWGKSAEHGPPGSPVWEPLLLSCCRRPRHFGFTLVLQSLSCLLRLDHDALSWRRACWRVSTPWRRCCVLGSKKGFPCLSSPQLSLDENVHAARWPLLALREGNKCLLTVRLTVNTGLLTQGLA